MKKILFLCLLLSTLPVYGDDLFTTDITNGCDVPVLGITDTVSLIAEYEPINITCSIGQYLPVNSIACANCPNEATCNGGTYTFNKTKSQGIVYNERIKPDKLYGCDDVNIGIPGTTVFVAEYEPNIINLNWYNGNEIIAQTTCTYDEQIILPPQPTKAGYNFVGWKIKAAN